MPNYTVNPNRIQRDYYEGNNYGDYQFTTLQDIINQFLVVYVGEGKIISKTNKIDVAFHAQRALQELSFDTFKSVKAQEIVLPPSLQMILPHDYVNYTNLAWSDASGIQHTIYPTSKTSNPKAFQQNADGSLKFENNTYQTTAADPFQEYGITKSGKTSAFDGNGLIKSDDPLEQYESEIRVSFDTDGTGNLKYGPTLFSSNSNERVSHGMFIQLREVHDLAVGMSVFGPGIPNGATIHAINSITGTGAFPYNVTLSTPEYEQWLLGGQVGTNTYGPTITASQILFDNEELVFVDLNRTSDTKTKYKSLKTIEDTVDNYDYNTDVYDLNQGQRYGLDPQHAQTNGSFYIDSLKGLIHFSSNISGKTVILNYISDSLGRDEEMQVHKFAQEAMYKHIMYAILSTKANVPEYIVRRYKQEKFAATRQAKLRLSNIKLEELTQILRGKSKWIKH